MFEFSDDTAAKRFPQNKELTASLSAKFSIPELSLVVDALRGVYRSQGIDPVEYLQGNLGYCVYAEKLDEKWGIDGKAFMGKIETLTPEEAEELILNAIRFWNNAPHESVTDGLRAIFGDIA